MSPRGVRGRTYVRDSDCWVEAARVCSGDGVEARERSKSADAPNVASLERRG